MQNNRIGDLNNCRRKSRKKKKMFTPNRQKIGHPGRDEDKPQLLKSIVDILVVVAEKDDRRSTEKLILQKLDDLHEAL